MYQFELMSYVCLLIEAGLAARNLHIHRPLELCPIVMHHKIKRQTSSH